METILCKREEYSEKGVKRPFLPIKGAPKCIYSIEMQPGIVRGCNLTHEGELHYDGFDHALRTP